MCEYGDGNLLENYIYKYTRYTDTLSLNQSVGVVLTDQVSHIGLKIYGNKLNEENEHTLNMI